MDFFIIIFLLIEHLLSDHVSFVQTLAFLRYLNTLRVITQMTEIGVIFIALIKALPMLLDTVFIMFFFISIFAIIGVHMFNGVLKKRCVSELLGAEYLSIHPDMTYYPCGNVDCPSGYYCAEGVYNPSSGMRSFDSIGFAYLQVIQVAFQDDYTKIMYNIEKVFTNYAWAWFIPIAIFGNYFLLNLMLVVIKDSVSASIKQHSEQQRQFELLQQQQKNKNYNFYDLKYQEKWQKGQQVISLKKQIANGYLEMNTFVRQHKEKENQELEQQQPDKKIDKKKTLKKSQTIKKSFALKRQKSDQKFIKTNKLAGQTDASAIQAFYNRNYNTQQDFFKKTSTWLTKMSTKQQFSGRVISSKLSFQKNANTQKLEASTSPNNQQTIDNQQTQKQKTNNLQSTKDIPVLESQKNLSRKGSKKIKKKKSSSSTDLIAQPFRRSHTLQQSAFAKQYNLNVQKKNQQKKKMEEEQKNEESDEDGDQQEEQEERSNQDNEQQNQQEDKYQEDSDSNKYKMKKAKTIMDKTTAQNKKQQLKKKRSFHEKVMINQQIQQIKGKNKISSFTKNLIGGLFTSKKKKKEQKYQENQENSKQNLNEDNINGNNSPEINLGVSNNDSFNDSSQATPQNFSSKKTLDPKKLKEQQEGSLATLPGKSLMDEEDDSEYIQKLKQNELIAGLIASNVKNKQNEQQIKDMLQVKQRRKKMEKVDLLQTIKNFGSKVIDTAKQQQQMLKKKANFLVKGLQNLMQLEEDKEIRLKLDIQYDKLYKCTSEQDIFRERFKVNKIRANELEKIGLFYQKRPVKYFQQVEFKKLLQVEQKNKQFQNLDKTQLTTVESMKSIKTVKETSQMQTVFSHKSKSNSAIKKISQVPIKINQIFQRNFAIFLKKEKQQKDYMMAKEKQTMQNRLKTGKTNKSLKIREFTQNRNAGQGDLKKKIKKNLLPMIKLRGGIKPLTKTQDIDKIKASFNQKIENQRPKKQLVEDFEKAYTQIYISDQQKQQINSYNWSGDNILNKRLVKRNNIIFKAINNPNFDIWMTSFDGLVKIFKRKALNLVESNFFIKLIIYFIVINSAVICLEGQISDTAYDSITLIISQIFLLEFLLKYFAYGQKNYFRDKMN